jgi:hypothetical protein
MDSALPLDEGERTRSCDVIRTESRRLSRVLTSDDDLPFGLSLSPASNNTARVSTLIPFPLTTHELVRH